MDFRLKKMIVAKYTAKFDDLAQYAPTMIATDDARKMKYKHDLSVEIVTQVDSGEVGPRTYPDTVQRALRINGWILINKPTFTQSVAEAGGNTNVQRSETRKFHPRHDRSQRNYGNQPQMKAHYYNPPANTSNFRSNEGQKESLKRGKGK